MYPQPFNYSGPDESLDMVGFNFLFAVEHSYILNNILSFNLKHFNEFWRSYVKRYFNFVEHDGIFLFQTPLLFYGLSK